MTEKFPPSETGNAGRRSAGLLGGIICFAVMSVVEPPAGMEPRAWAAAAVAVLMALWWLSEAVEVPVTGLIPIIAFPLFGVTTLERAAAPYAHPLIFLFLGGFILASALERWDLHRRLALMVLPLFGNRPDALIGGIMASTAFLSLWVSNTATAVMMVPIGLSLIAVVRARAEGKEAQGRAFATAMMLGIAYSASIGGLGTLIGTPPNALLAAYMAQTQGITIGFARWMLIGIPLVIVLLPLAWWLLTRVLVPVGREPLSDLGLTIAREKAALGPMLSPQKRVGIVFLLVALAWVGHPAIEIAVPGLAIDDAAIAIIAAVALFILPAGSGKGERLIDWGSAERLPWGVLILFGGGLSLAAAIQETGLSQWIGDALIGIAAWPPVLVAFVLVVVVIFLTELTSNTATAAVFLPIAAALSGAVGVPVIFLALPVALAASCGFMLPAGTPPNAIVFGSRQVTLPEMARAGILLNVIASLVITGTGYLLAVKLFGN